MMRKKEREKEMEREKKGERQKDRKTIVIGVKRRGKMKKYKTTGLDGAIQMTREGPEGGGEKGRRQVEMDRSVLSPSPAVKDNETFSQSVS